jgi:4-oxalocrotonate tautomerase
MGNDATKRRAIPRQFPRPLPLRRQRLRGIDPADRTGQASGRAASSVKIKRRTTMPLIEVHLIENVFDSAQKKQIIEKLTDAMVSIEGENMRGVTWVKISEVTSGEWGIGGQPLTTEAVKALAAGMKAA